MSRCSPYLFVIKKLSDLIQSLQINFEDVSRHLFENIKLGNFLLQTNKKSIDETLSRIDYSTTSSNSSSCRFFPLFEEMKTVFLAWKDLVLDHLDDYLACNLIADFSDNHSLFKCQKFHWQLRMRDRKQCALEVTPPFLSVNKGF